MKNDKVRDNNLFVDMAVTGEVDPQRALSITRQYINLAYQYPNHNILVDLREIKATIDITTLMAVTQEVVSRVPDFRHKIAHLIDDQGERIRVARQLESCMVLKGLAYKVFTDYKAATGWLSKAS